MIDILFSKESLALIAIALTMAGYFQYFRTIFAGTTKPHMFSWLIWATLTAIAFFAQMSDGGGAGAWVTGTSAFVSFIIAGYAFFKGEKDIKRSDWVTFLIAVSSIPLWIITDDALLAVIIITIIDALGFYPTFRKSWQKPFEESMFHYATAGIKFILAIIALENYSMITVLYPLSLVIMNGLFVGLLIIRRKQISQKPV